MMEYTINQPFLNRQTTKQIEIIQVLVSPKVYKLNDSFMNKGFIACHTPVSNRLTDSTIK